MTAIMAAIAGTTIAGTWVYAARLFTRPANPKVTR